MERNITSTVNSQIYRYQQSVNSQPEGTSNSDNLNSYGMNNSHNVNIQAASQNNRNLRTNGTTSSENANLIEILQSATDESKLSHSSNVSNANNRFCYDEDFLGEDSYYEAYSSGGEFSNEELFDTKYKVNTQRCSSAPTKPKNEAEEFRYSSKYDLLEKLSRWSTAMVIGSDGKFDVDSEEGGSLFKNFLEGLEMLIEVFFLLSQ